MQQFSLKDDFPRKLSEFERTKIAQNIKLSLSTTFPLPNISPVNDRSVQEPIPDNVSLVLDNLERWSVRASCASLANLDFDRFGSSIRNDDRFTKFVSAIAIDQCSPESLAALARIVFSANRSSVKLQTILSELILKRDFRCLNSDQLIEISKIASCDFHLNSSPLLALSEHALHELDLSLLLELTAYGLSVGKMIIAPHLIPLLTKTQLIRLVQILHDCEFPDLIASTLSQIANELTRLSFRRLVDEGDRKILLKALFRLKSKLDSFVCIEGNPFYHNHHHYHYHQKGNYMQKILKTLSFDFHHSATSVPLPDASNRMVCLLGLNKLQLESVDLIANRISAFGKTLLDPSTSISPSEFTGLLFVLTRHPHSWKRRDRYRAMIASNLASAFALHAQDPRISSHEILSCISSLMTVHNKQVRQVVGEAMKSIDPSSLGHSHLIDACGHFSVLLKHDEHANLETLNKIINVIQIDALSTPQLVDLLTACKDCRIVNRVDQIAKSLERRVLGGSISSTNVTRAVNALGYLQIRGIENLISALLQCLPNDTSPRLAARLLSGIAAIGIANPPILSPNTHLIENIFLAISSGDQMRQVLSNPLLASELTKSLSLLADPGIKFQSHLSSLAITDNEGIDDSVSRKIDAKGPLPKASALLGDLLGALVSSPDSNPESGGFELLGLRTWRNPLLMIQVSIVKASQCARDDPRHILGPACASISIDRASGWNVIVLPADLLEQTAQLSGHDTIRKGVRRAKLVCKGQNIYTVLQEQFKHILSSDSP